MTLAFKELAGSPVESFGPEGPRAQRRILVAWEQRHAMVVELLGNGYVFGSVGQSGYPDCPVAAAMHVHLEPWPPCPDDQGAFDDIKSQLNSYSGKYALIVVDYDVLYVTASRTNLPVARPGTVLIYRMKFSRDYLTLPGQAMHWASDATLPVPPDALPAIRLPIAEHHVTWHRVVDPPWAALRACIGTVNGGTFLGAGAETVLFDGATADCEFLGLDQLQQPQFGWRLGYVFRERTIHSGGNTYGWNHCYRSLPQNSPAWDKLIDHNGESLYRTSDFNSLFQFDEIA